MNKNFNMSNKISDQTYQAIIGNLLGDAHLGFTRKNKHTGQPIGNSQLSMSLKSNEYISYLVNKFYISICNTNQIKPVVKNNIVTHYRF
jgi:hypothetical protein